MLSLLRFSNDRTKLIYLLYVHVPTKYDYSSHNNGRRDYPAVACEDNSTKEDNKLDEKLTTRCCWDGGLLSNTPLREVISKHKLFWEVQREVKPQKIKFTTWDESLWLY